MPRRKSKQTYDDEYDDEYPETPDHVGDPSEHRKGKKTVKNNRLPFQWIERQFIEGDYTDTLKWQPWRKNHTSSTGIKSFKTQHDSNILIMITKTAYHPVKNELADYNPDLVIGLWSKDFKDFISYIIPSITYTYPKGKDRWSQTPKEHYGFQTYKKILHPDESGIQQHYYPLYEYPDSSDFLQIIKQEIEDLKGNSHF